jgi:sporulation protein YlmC with PRC-barrel domain
MHHHFIKLVLLAALLGFAWPACAEAPGGPNAENAEMAAELIGAPVFARDGEQVGEVADISFDEEGLPRALRMKTSAHLGLGTRLVEVSKNTFITLRGAVSLEITADEVEALTEVLEPRQGNPAL